ncbi:hypothetical protein [Pedococcus dokdonensis]|uniref:hypothetical protein n=1 Tax=Pedococcus dokdonensis TaxID=443156 RepID=UPI000B8884DD|nr:hypothetical protein [Pedococcus dokdonensis]
MSIFKRRAAEPVGPVERPQVRQYRYLLGTADLPSLERLHDEALGTLDVLIRAHILRTAQDRTLSGRELTVDDVPEMARLLARAEVQAPGIVLGALTDAALERLAHRVVTLPDAEPHLEGYSGWDGVALAPRGLQPTAPDAVRETVVETSPVIMVAPQTASIGAPRSLASP